MSSHSNSSSSSGYVMTQTATTTEQMAYTSADICSVQSTSRPGCIIELDLLKNSKKVNIESRIFLSCPVFLLCARKGDS